MKNKIALFTRDDIGAEVTAHLLEEHFELIHITSIDDPEIKSDEFVLILCDDDENQNDRYCAVVNQSIPVLFLTEKSNQEIEEIMDNTERNFAFLRKPFVPQQLLISIHMILTY